MTLIIAFDFFTFSSTQQEDVSFLRIKLVCDDWNILEAVERVNARQKTVLVQMVKEELGDDLTGKKLAIWGLAFKPETDDMREAPSLEIIKGLHEAGAQIVAFAPQAAETSKEAIKAPFDFLGPY